MSDPTFKDIYLQQEQKVAMAQEQVRVLKEQYERVWQDLAYAEDALRLEEARFQDLEVIAGSDYEGLFGLIHRA